MLLFFHETFSHFDDIHEYTKLLIYLVLLWLWNSFLFFLVLRTWICYCSLYQMLLLSYHLFTEEISYNTLWLYFKIIYSWIILFLRVFAFLKITYLLTNHQYLSNYVCRKYFSWMLPSYLLQRQGTSSWKTMSLTNYIVGWPIHLVNPTNNCNYIKKVGAYDLSFMHVYAM